MRRAYTVWGPQGMLEQGYWAEIITGNEHLRLFAEETPSGVYASVYSVNEKVWVAPSELVEDIEDGKDRATAHAAAYLRKVANCDIPPLNWKRARSVKDD